MKKHVSILLVLGLMAVTATSVNAQCKTFAKNVCKPMLDPFIHDGNYNAAILTEGEEAELYKTFYSGQTYRISICGSEALPNIEFKVLDSEDNVIFDNKQSNFTQKFDFKTPTSQQLKIYIKVPASGKNQEEINSGCIAIMFGFKDE